jgi:hypothetical protein
LKKKDSRASRNTAPKGTLKVYSVRDAVRQLYNSRIKTVVEDQAKEDDESGDKLKYYPAALTTVMKSLTEEQLKSTEDMAKEWNKKRPSVEVQRM